MIALNTCGPLVNATAITVIMLCILASNVVAFALGVKVLANQQRRHIETASDCKLCGSHLR